MLPCFGEFFPYVYNEGCIVEKFQNHGRPQDMLAMDCLALLLSWSHTHFSLVVIQLIFCMTMSPVCKYFQLAWRVVTKVLKSHNHTKISMLWTTTEMKYAYTQKYTNNSHKQVFTQIHGKLLSSSPLSPMLLKSLWTLPLLSVSLISSLISSGEDNLSSNPVARSVFMIVLQSLLPPKLLLLRDCLDCQ